MMIMIMIIVIVIIVIIIIIIIIIIVIVIISIKKTLLTTFSHKPESYMYLVKIQKFYCP